MSGELTMNLKTISAIGLLKQALDTLPPDAFPEYRNRIDKMIGSAGDVLAPEDLSYESDNDFELPADYDRAESEAEESAA
jgi:hypothetical protein